MVGEKKEQPAAAGLWGPTKVATKYDSALGHVYIDSKTLSCEVMSLFLVVICIVQQE